MAFRKALVTSLATFTGIASAQSGPACSFMPGNAVNTTSGRVTGHRAHNATQVSEYLGIPFAQPPVGDLRFAPPVRYTGTGDISGDSYGHDCPSSSSSVPSFLSPNVYNLLSQLGQVGDDQQEDCLYVNVWSKPQSGTASKPVLVWIYGGGFNTGGTNSSAYSGQFWADTEDVVFVNFNYRLNIFGFPGAPGETQNVGLLDQRMALEWVRDNIAGFGGDPSRITIFGQSAGGASVDLYTYAWTSDPIISGAIAQSGTANSFGNKLPATAAEHWYQVSSKLGCGDNTTSDASTVLSCMRSSNTTMSDLLAAEAAGSGLASVLGNFGPTVDNATVFADYSARALNGDFIKIPTIYGNNDYEAGLFILITAGTGTTIPLSTWTAFTAGEFTCPIGTAAELRAQAGLPTWRYRYFGMFPNIELPTSAGKAWHGAELLPMFGSSEEVTKQDSTWQERQLGSYMRGAWAAFARCPGSGLSAYGWPVYSNESKSLVQLGMGDPTNVPSFNASGAYDGACGTFPYGGTLNM
ncbi:MAG: hypothetical protein M1828_002702 [Chrysothrix sp. TS-e1954]|nr:MAG: hypothetical protein M1828_002702 [Chrysothrix sp. TS-e1954]